MMPSVPFSAFALSRSRPDSGSKIPVASFRPYSKWNVVLSRKKWVNDILKISEYRQE